MAGDFNIQRDNTRPREKFPQTRSLAEFEPTTWRLCSTKNSERYRDGKRGIT